jgi:hypothetical protein
MLTYFCSYLVNNLYFFEEYKYIFYGDKDYSDTEMWKHNEKLITWYEFQLQTLSLYFQS